MDIKSLIANLKHDDPLTRIHAAMSLGALGEDAVDAVPALIELLETGTIQDKRVAAVTLGDIGPVACDAIPALADAASSEDEMLSQRALWALEIIDEEQEGEDWGEAAA